MFCHKCGAQVPEGGSFCQKCGAAVDRSAAESQPSNITHQPVPTAAAATTSGFAIASLVLGITGFLLNFLSILAIVFGAIGISQTGKNPNLKGRGMAIVGLVLGIIVIFFWIIIITWIGTFFWWL